MVEAHPKNLGLKPRIYFSIPSQEQYHQEVNSHKGTSCNRLFVFTWGWSSMAIVQCIWNNPLFLDRSNTEKDIKLKRCSIDMLMPKCEVFFGRHLSPVACGRLTDIFMKSMLWVQYTYTFLVSNSRNAQNYTCIGPRFIAVTFHHASITKHKIKWCNIVYKLPDLFIFLIDTSLAPLGEISIPGCWTWSAEPPSSRWWPMLYPQHWISRTSGAALPCREWKKKD